MNQECEIFRVFFYLYMNIYGDFQICISVPLIFDNNYIWDNSVYTEIKVGVTKQIDSAYFRIIFTQDWTVNSFQGVQGKQNFIWSTGNNGNTTLFHLVCNCKKDLLSLESSVWTWAQQRWLTPRLIRYLFFVSNGFIKILCLCILGLSKKIFSNWYEIGKSIELH